MRKKQGKKLLAMVLSIGMAAGLLSGCTTKEKAEVTTSGEGTQEAGKTVVSYWSGLTGADGDVLQDLITVYNETNALNVEVRLDTMPWDSLYQKLSTTLAVGEGPDIFTLQTERIGTYAKPGALASLDSLYAEKGVDASVIPPAYEKNLKYNGSYYGVPQNFATLLLYYNKDLFKKAGLDPEAPPTNWDELEEYALKLSGGTGGEQQYGFGLATNNTIPMWPILLWQNGGDFIGADGVSVFNSPENIETVTRWSKLIKEDKIAPPTMTGGEIDKLFESGKLGMYFCGPWTAVTLEKTGVSFEYGIAQVPVGPKTNVTLGNGVATVMASSSKKQEAVYDFLKYWNSVDTQVIWSLETGFPPARTDILEDERLKENPYVLEFAKASEHAEFYLQQLMNFDQIESQAILPAMESILLTDEDVKTALDKAAATMNTLLAH